ncbi:MAG: hypothetical protein FJ207_10950 [Gemmatimonadetes bacterium]|nr:hypothetical protein [Gemmatimonadota bacterium]
MTGPLSATANFQLTYSVADVALPITATQPQDIQLVAQDGNAPISWNLLSGVLPLGLTLSGSGRLSGLPMDVGTFPIRLRATDAIGLTDSATVTLQVGDPPITIAELTSPFLLSGTNLDPVLATFLDRQGNRVGGFDVGDFRAWVLAHPSLPLSAAVAPAASAPQTVVVPLRLPARSDVP